MTVDDSQAPPRRSAWASVAAVWIVTTLGGVLAAVYADPDARLQWFPIVLAGATILAFCLQLALDSKVGFVNRMMASITGSVIILAVATGILAVVTAAAG